MSTNRFPLCDVPERIFDPAAWAELVELVGGRTDAIDRLTWTDEDTFRHVRRYQFSQGGERAADAEVKERIYQLKIQLMDEFKHSVRTGVLVLSGIELQARYSLEAEIVDYLTFDFKNSVAHLGSREIFAIRVEISKSQPSIAAVVDWLDCDQTNQMKTKANLLHSAQQALPNMTVRVFNAAYKRVFERERGRPKKRTAKT